MPVSIGMLRRARERYNRLTPEARLIEDAYWARQERIDRILFIIGAVWLVVCAGVLIWEIF